MASSRSSGMASDVPSNEMARMGIAAGSFELKLYITEVEPSIWAGPTYI